MASLCVLLFFSALTILTSQSRAGVIGGRGLDLRHPLLYNDPLTSRLYNPENGGANELFYQSDGWRGRGLERALQRLVERDEQEAEQRAAYLAAVLRLLGGSVAPGDNEEEEEEEEEEEGGQGGGPGRRGGAWGARRALNLLHRMAVNEAQTERKERIRQTIRNLNRGDPQEIRRVVARLRSGVAPDDGPAHRRARRSLGDGAPPSPSNAPPLLRVKRLEEERPRPPAVAGQQRMRRTDAMETDSLGEVHHGKRRRRRRALLNYNPQILIHEIHEILEDMRMEG